jgi:hypothetical protein
MKDNREESLYMAEGYHSLALKAEWFYVEVHLFWISM